MPAMQSRWIHEMSWPQIAAYLEHDDIVLIPVGATEQHGEHLALFTDSGWAVGVAEGAAELADVLIAPPVYYGWGPHHMAYPGTITLRAETLTQVCVDIGTSLAYHGFKKLIFVNGNRVANLPPMEIAASKLRFTTSAFVAVADTGLIAKRQVREICASEYGGLGHAGESETAYMLYRFPHLVDMSKAVEVVKQPGRFHHTHMPMEPPYDADSVFVPRTDEEFRSGTAPTGVHGNARLATSENGEKIHHALTHALADFIEQQVRPVMVTLKPLTIPT